MTEDHKDGPVQSILRLGSKHGANGATIKKIRNGTVSGRASETGGGDQL
jgi:hypothetical protein